MSEHVNSIRFEIYNHFEDLSPSELKEIMADNDPSFGYEPEPADVYRIGVVIDGYHVRSAITTQEGLEPHTLAKWIDDLGFWLLTNHQRDVMQFDAFVAWDAEIAEDSRNRPGFINLPANEQQRYLRARSQHLTGSKTENFQAIWHFYALHVERRSSSVNADGVKQDTLVWPRQSGIDARIATSLFEHALDGVNHLVLVTRDADYADALRAIRLHFDHIQIDVLTMAARPPVPFDNIAHGLWTGTWDGNSMTVKVALPYSKMRATELS